MGLTYLKLIGAMVIWGGTFIAGKIAVQSMGPFSGAFCRFAIASLCLLPICYAWKGQLPRLKLPQLVWVGLMGLSGVVAYNAFFFLGLKLIPAGRASLIVALNPIAIALSAALFLREPLSSVKLVGIGMSLVGAAIVIGQGNPIGLLTQGIQLGDLYLLACVASWVAYTLASRQALTQVSSLVATTYACSIGAVGLLLPALWEGLIPAAPSFRLEAWLAVAYGGILGSAVAFILYADGVRALGPAKAGSFINLVPPSAIVLAALILQEQITPSLLVGGSLIIAGVITANRG
jgi:drug/metabolite transporter (DMT)-like permease